jgi:hypothetical protein
MPYRSALAAAFLALTPVPTLRAAEPTAEQLAFFENKVRPVLSTRCYSCHSQTTKKPKGGLVLDRRAAMLAGGDSGPALVPGKPAASLLVKAVRYDGLEMPPTGKLPADEIAILTRWVEMGAPWPETVAKPVAGPEVGVFTPERLKHWAFQPLKATDPPAPTEADRTRHPIDRFVLASLAAKGLKPSPPAGRRTLIRRAYLDLVGLPPSPEEVEAFVADGAADAYPKLIDNLLASPHYGERWGRHWLDVARYSDGHGGFLDPAPLPEAWRYRDWVVKALNDDLPYHTFVKYQIAGDLTGNGWEAAAATGFLAVGSTYVTDGDDPESVAKAKAETLDDRVDTVTRGVLGLTVSCARCHDHKFDPIPQADYYALAAVFNNTRVVDRPAASPDVLNRFDEHRKLADAANAAVRDWQAEVEEEASRRLMRAAGRYLDAVVAFHRLPEPRDVVKFAQQEKLSGTALRAWTDALRKPKAAETYSDLREWLAAGPFDPAGSKPENLTELREDFQARLDRLLDRLPAPGTKPAPDFRPLAPEDQKLYAALRAGPCQANPEESLSDADRTKRKELESEVARLKAAAPPAPGRMHAVEDAGAADMHLALRGDLRKPGPVVPRRFLRALAGPNPPVWTKGSGRLQLAEALTDATNPLTPRVMVNRVWQHHFGRPLVATPSNFGLLGDKPSHPELLDWLAARFVADGWSLKKLHRLIVLSDTYKMSSRFDADGFRIDGDNRYLWRFSPRRLEVEAWRDGVLAVTGELDRTTGGPPVGNILAGPRRTLYAAVSRNGDKLPSDDFLRLFDFPSVRATVSERTTSTVPQQSLFLLNSPYMIARGKAFAARLTRDARTTDARIDRAYALVYGRAAADDERKLATAFLGAGEDAELWARYAQALLSSYEFMQTR